MLEKCWFKPVEGNVAASTEHDSLSEKEWDLEASYTIEEFS